VKGFSRLDYCIVVGYVVAVAVLGSSFYRRGSTAKDYFLGGRLISWIPAGISIVAADLSAITVMGIPAWSYAHNLQLMWYSATYLLAAPVVIYIFIPFYSRLHLFTAYEYLERRFNLSVRLVTSALFQALRAAHVAIALYAPSLIINLVTGIPVWKCILCMGAFTTIYTVIGGMKAVIWTDVLQFCTVGAGLLSICTVAIDRVPGKLGGVYRIAGAAGRLSFLNLSTDPSERTSLWACLIGGFVLVLTGLTTDQSILQRLFTTKSAADAKRSIILQTVVNIPVIMLLNLIGITLFAFYSSHQAGLAGLSKNDAIVPFFAVTQLPTGVSGLVIAAICAASMGVMSAGINALSTATTVDFYQRVIRPTEAPEHYAFVGRILTAGWGICCAALALFAGRLGDLALAFYRVSSFVCGPLLGIFLLGSATKRTTSRGALIGGVAGASVVLLLTLFTDWNFFYKSAIGLMMTFASGYVGSFLESPPTRETIQPYVL
jgi:sodium-coupled monocarboxylate transporter 8/12